jgi:hypothetical protein
VRELDLHYTISLILYTDSSTILVLLLAHSPQLVSLRLLSSHISSQWLYAGGELRLSLLLASDTSFTRTYLLRRALVGVRGNSMKKSTRPRDALIKRQKPTKPTITGTWMTMVVSLQMV